MSKIGYNPKIIQELANSIADTFNTLGQHISDNWSAVPTVLQENWKGNDEQNFESQLAYRVRLLYDKSRELVSDAAHNMIQTGIAWQDYQNGNRLTGVEGSIEAVNYNFEMPTIKEADLTNVKLVENKFGGEDLAITDNTAPAIKAVIEDYTNTIKTKVNNIYESLDSNLYTAFHGDQTAKIKKYLEAVTKALASFNTHLNDFYSKVDPLITGGYGAADTELGAAFDKVTNSASADSSSLDIGI